jgi:uncharacterized OB-fold protein
MADVVDVYRSPHVLEYPYVRSTGPVVGAYLTALRDGKIVGIRGTGGKVIVPPTEYDPDTGEETTDIVEVGPAGTVTTWAWVNAPRPDAPHGVPFAWAMVRPDGADTAMLATVVASGPEAITSGMRVTAEFRPAAEREGAVQDLHCFVPEEAS